MSTCSQTGILELNVEELFKRVNHWSNRVAKSGNHALVRIVGVLMVKVVSLIGCWTFRSLRSSTRYQSLDC